MWLYGWKSHILSHHPAKFGDLRLYGSGNMIFLTVKGQESTCSGSRYIWHFYSHLSTQHESTRHIVWINPILFSQAPERTVNEI